MPFPFTTAVGKAIHQFFEDLATPVSRDALGHYQRGEWDQLAAMRVNPEHYSSSEAYWLDASAVSLLRKCESLPTTHDRKAVAEEGFLLNEKKCFRTNHRLYAYLCPGLPDTEQHVLDHLDRARKIVRRILGDRPPEVEGKHGPGATYGDRGESTTLPHKMSSEPTLTSSAWPFRFQWSGTYWAKACASLGKDPVIVPGNRFTTVPKDCEKNRPIAVEPSINVFYQLGIGRAIRRALRREGIDLQKGQDIHRQVACEASIRGHLATLDLSNASDTVCRNLVKLLLPPRWYETLDDLRSKKTYFRGRWHLLEKFSSMGNGFTFELETLVFLSLILAVSDDLVAGVNCFVYGDDIIVPTERSKEVIAVLEFYGFGINKAKSFVSGPFRESCGGDYFRGVDVRPYFLKESPCEPQQLIAFANGLRRASAGNPSFRRDFVRRSWFRILDGIPGHIRSCRGPEGLGDLVIHDDRERWQSKQRNSIRWIRVYRPCRYRKIPWGRFHPDTILATALYGALITPGGVIPRDAVSGFKIGWAAYS